MAAAPQPTVGILPEEADLHTAEARVNKHKADWRGWKFMWPFAVVFVFVFIIPIVYAIYISFFKKQMVGGTKFVGFENYARLIQDPQFWSSVGRVTIFTVFQVPIMLFCNKVRRKKSACNYFCRICYQLRRAERDQGHWF